MMMTATLVCTLGRTSALEVMMIDSTPWERQTETWRNEVLGWRHMANREKLMERNAVWAYVCLSLIAVPSMAGVCRGPSLGRTHPGPLKLSRTQRTFVTIGYVTHCLLY